LAAEDAEESQGWVAEAIVAAQDFLKAFDISKTDMLVGILLIGAAGILMWKLPSIMEVRNRRLEIMKSHERELFKLKAANERQAERDRAKIGRK
jgi:hypothetical protein